MIGQIERNRGRGPCISRNPFFTPSACPSALDGTEGHRHGVDPPSLISVKNGKLSHGEPRRHSPPVHVGARRHSGKRVCHQFRSARQGATQPLTGRLAARPDAAWNKPKLIMTEAAKVNSIYRYPVKGLSPEPLMRAHLEVGATVPGDRLYAIENGPSGFDPAAPRYQPKQRYLMLMRNERLATLRSRFDDASHTLVVESEGRKAVRGDLRTSAGRAAIEEFFAGFCAPDLRGPPKVLHAPGFSFS